jgi:hypothetical protein
MAASNIVLPPGDVPRSSGVSSSTSKTAGLGGVEQPGLGGGHVLKDVHRGGVVWRPGDIDGRSGMYYKEI